MLNAHVTFFPSVLWRYQSQILGFCATDLIWKLGPTPLSQNTKSPSTLTWSSTNNMQKLSQNYWSTKEMLKCQKWDEKYVSARLLKEIAGGGVQPLKQRETNKWLILSRVSNSFCETGQRKEGLRLHFNTFAYLASEKWGLGVAGRTETREIC